MRNTANAHRMAKEITSCPYCGAQTGIELAPDYAPKFVHCEACGARFIVERLAKGYQLLTVEEAPCCSNPECRELEMGGYDEE